MDTIESRISRLKKHIISIHQTIYPDDHQEVKEIMLTALRDRIAMLEELNSPKYLPQSE